MLLLLFAYCPFVPAHAGANGERIAIDPAAPLFSADGYRAAHYRAALPAAPPAGERIDAAELAVLIAQQHPVLIDVQAITLRPETQDFGIAWLPSQQRFNIPGSRWLPNVGYAELSPRMQRFFAGALQRFTAGDRDRPIVFYCVIDCWMSWNAVKRASNLGYRTLYWFPEGSDGWHDAGFALVAAQPEPIPDMPTPPRREQAAGD